jgi:REP element-mobilizing transposase RayT
MGRGIEGRKIFLNTKDRNDFIALLQHLAEDRSMTVYAWALLPNHFHLLCKTGKRPLSASMRKLLTGYVVNFNKRHRRPCQSSLTGQAWPPFSEPIQIHRCQEDIYLLELVRYIHLGKRNISKELSTFCMSIPYNKYGRIHMKTLLFFLIFFFGLEYGAVAEKRINYVLNVVENAWEKADGAAWFRVDGAIVELLIIAPQDTLPWLVEHKEIADRLLDEWQHSVFTDYKGTEEEELVQLKSELTKTLEKYESKDQNIMVLKKRILDELKAITIRKIE